MRTNVTGISKYYLEEVLAKGKQFPKGVWNCNEKYDNAKEVTKTLIEKVLKWSDDEIKRKLSANIFIQNSLYGMLVILFNGSPYLAIENAYPGKFKPWELPCVSNSFWNLKTAKEATIWLIEEKLKWNDDDIKEKLSANTFIKNSLTSIISLFNGSPYFAIENAYPGKFKSWEFSKVPKNFWNMETAKKATMWLIEEKLKWSDEDVRRNLSQNTFKENSLRGMLAILFNESPYRAIENAYPGKFKPWELPSVPKKFWNLETAKEATIWLIEEKLKWSDEDVKKKLTLNTFKENSLKSMLNYLFNIDPHQPVEMHLKINFKDLTLIFNNNNLIIK